MTDVTTNRTFMVSFQNHEHLKKMNNSLNNVARSTSSTSSLLILMVQLERQNQPNGKAASVPFLFLPPPILDWIPGVQQQGRARGLGREPFASGVKTLGEVEGQPV